MSAQLENSIARREEFLREFFTFHGHLQSDSNSLSLSVSLPLCDSFLMREISCSFSVKEQKVNLSRLSFRIVNLFKFTLPAVLRVYLPYLYRSRVVECNPSRTHSSRSAGTARATSTAVVSALDRIEV